MSDVEQRIANWRTDLTESQALSPSDMDEMENHLREEVTNLQTTGLSPTEAFLVAQYRLGETDALAIEFRKINTEWNSLKRLTWMALGAFIYLVSSYVVAGIWHVGIAAATHYRATGVTMLALSIITKIILIAAALGLFWIIGRLWLHSESGRRWPAFSHHKLMLLCTTLVVADLTLIASQLLFRMAVMQNLGPRPFGSLSMFSAYAGLIWIFFGPLVAATLVIVFRARVLRHREVGTAGPSE